MMLAFNVCESTNVVWITSPLKTTVLSVPKQVPRTVMAVVGEPTGALEGSSDVSVGCMQAPAPTGNCPTGLTRSEIERTIEYEPGGSCGTVNVIR